MELLDACTRLVDLLNAPQDIPFLGSLQREIIFRLLRSPQGKHLRATATLGEQSNRTAKAVEVYVGSNHPGAKGRGGDDILDRSSVNAWDDARFVEAVKATKRNHLIIAGCPSRYARPFRRSLRKRPGYEPVVALDAFYSELLVSIPAADGFRVLRTEC